MNLAQYLQHIFDMCGKGREILCDVLSVTDITQLAAVHTDISFFAGNMESALRHDTTEHNGLNRYGFSASIRTCYDDSPRLTADFKLQWNVECSVHQRVPCVF